MLVILVLELVVAAGAWREALEIVESLRSRGVVPGSRCEISKARNSVTVLVVVL